MAAISVDALRPIRFLWRRSRFRFRAWANKRRSPIKGIILPAVVAAVLGIAGYVAIDRNVASQVATLTQSPSTSAPQTPRSHAPQRRVRVIDGDTIVDTTTGERIRLSNIDTPETGGRAQCRAERLAGEAATRAAREIVESGTVTLRRSGRTDRYGRTIGSVLVDGRDLGEIMMERGLARPWRGRREAWCAADGSLLPAR